MSEPFFKAEHFTGIDMQQREKSTSRYGLSPIQAQRIADCANKLRDAEMERLKTAVRQAISNCQLSCLGGDCGAEWNMKPQPCPYCTPLFAALERTKVGEG